MFVIFSSRIRPSPRLAPKGLVVDAGHSPEAVTEAFLAVCGIGRDHLNLLAIARALRKKLSRPSSAGAPASASGRRVLGAVLHFVDKVSVAYVASAASLLPSVLDEFLIDDEVGEEGTGEESGGRMVDEVVREPNVS